jgi:hypothetical protein
MNFLLYSITVFNFLALLYLAFIVYKRNLSQKKVAKPLLTQSDVDLTGLNKAISKVGLTRFNPFDGLGGDQSFIITLLDKQDSGIILTSLHNRDFTRVYAKTIKDGQPQNTTLSKEEKNAILKTING